MIPNVAPVLTLAVSKRLFGDTLALSAAGIKYSF